MNDTAHTDLHIEISFKDIERTDPIAQHIHTAVNKDLARFASKLTRVEVHLADLNAGKPGPDDKRCLIEARPRGLDPLTAEATDSDLYKAVSDAASKLQRVLDSTFGRLSTH